MKLEDSNKQNFNLEANNDCTIMNISSEKLCCLKPKNGWGITVTPENLETIRIVHPMSSMNNLNNKGVSDLKEPKVRQSIILRKECFDQLGTIESISSLGTKY